MSTRKSTVQSSTPPALGQTLRAARQTRGLTLEDLAKVSGISKSMLSQIERNEVNPTFAILWSLTQALGTSIGALVGEDEPGTVTSSIETVPPQHVPSLTTGGGACVLRILSPPQFAGDTEWYELTLAKGAVLDSPPHEADSFEHLAILDGEVEVRSGGETAQSSAGGILRYPVDRPHAIKNTGQGKARAWMVVIHKRG